MTLKSLFRAWTEQMVGPTIDEKVAALASRDKNEYGVDPFGFSLDYSLSAVAPLLWLYKHYFRVETFNINKVPAGRVLLVGNHSGQLPFDAVMVGVSMLIDGQPPRAVRSMVEKWASTLPWVSTFMARVGQIVGTPENCRRLLESGEAILVFPEGVRGIMKVWSKRYQLQQFGLGFMRLALETNTPIVPVAVVGAEEQAPTLLHLRSVAKMMGFPGLPLTTPVPLPTKYRIYYGDPMFFTGRADDEDSELEKKVMVVKASIQSMLEQGLRDRKHVFW